MWLRLRRRPASLNRRLLLAAAGLIAIALVLAAMIIAFILQRFITSQIDGRLDSQIVFLASMLRADDGTIALTGDANGPPFDSPAPREATTNASPPHGPPFARPPFAGLPFAGPQRGWYWEVIGPRNTLLSRALDGAAFAVPSFHPSPDGDRPAPAEGRGPQNQPLHFRIQPLALGTGGDGVPVTIVATAPRSAVSFPLRAAMSTLAFSLVALGIALLLAILFQVRVGLRPLEHLRAAVADVRNGRRDRVPEAQPREIKPLVSELNALLAQNAANLERARAHVANLAHALKTPLASLALALEKQHGPDDDDLAALVALMDRRIRHHLGRARAAALSGPVRARTTIAPRIADLAAVLGKIHAEKPIALTQDVPPDLAVACEAQDFDEMVGNLFDNAFKWARGRVAIQATLAEGRQVAIAIEDDGPGVPAAQIPHVLQPGARADENAPGFGFGLPIARELAALYGGTIDFGTATLGGLKATLRLPLAG